MTALLENLGYKPITLDINSEKHTAYVIHLRDDNAMVHAGKNYYYRCPKDVSDAVFCLYALYLTAMEYLNVTDYSRSIATEALRKLGCEAMTDFCNSNEHYWHCVEERDSNDSLCKFTFTPDFEARRGVVA